MKGGQTYDKENIFCAGYSRYISLYRQRIPAVIFERAW